LLLAVVPFVGVQGVSLPAVEQDATPAPTEEPVEEPTEEATEEATAEATAEATEAAASEATPEPAAPAAGESTITLEELANLSYQSFLAPSGVVTLTDGMYEDTENRIVVGIGMTPTVAYGTIDGQDAAVVIVGENGGGSGLFENLALVLDQDGVPTNVAITLLGDRVAVKGLTITDGGLIVVDMVAQGPNDAMCCPTMPVTRIYAYTFNQLAPVAQVAATIDGSPATQQVLATIIAATAYDDTIPPGAQGQPKHPVWSLDLSEPEQVMNTGGAYVAIYNVAAYEQMWNAAGDNYVADSIATLRRLLQEQPADLTQSPPILPEQPAGNDIVAQLQYLDLPDGGSGVRWVGRLVQDAAPVMAEGSLRYFFQGLSADGQRLIVSQVPITVPVVAGVYTDTVSAEEYDALVADWDAYLAEVTASLNALTADETTPGLDALDQVMQSVTISESVNALLPGVLNNLAYTSTLTEGPIQFVDGRYEDVEQSINAVILQTPPIAYGYLNGGWSAVVLFGENGGGSGVFTVLNVVQDVDGAATPVASTLLGDRVVIHNVSIVGDRIYVDMTTQGPDEPMCCPTLRVEREYTLEGGELVLQDETPQAPAAGVDAGAAMTETEAITGTESVTETDTATGTEAAADATAEAAAETIDLAGTSWLWVQTLMSDGALTEPAQTDAFQLTFSEDGAVSTTTDCNTAAGSYTVDGNQISIEFGPMTMMACPEGSQQDAYLSHLGSVQSYLFVDGNLILELPFDSGGMTFAPAQ
jgi:heat shock protein HslJ